MSVGIKCSFVAEDEGFLTYTYNGGTFTSSASWSGLNTEAVDAVKDEMQNLSAVVGSRSIKSYEMGYFKLNTGDVVESANHFYNSQYIPCVKGDDIEWLSGSSNNSMALVYYDKDKNFLNYHGNTQSPRKITNNVANSAFIRASFLWDKREEAYLKINGETKYTFSEELLVNSSGLCKQLEGIEARLDGHDSILSDEHVFDIASLPEISGIRLNGYKWETQNSFKCVIFEPKDMTHIRIVAAPSSDAFIGFLLSNDTALAPLYALGQVHEKIDKDTTREFTIPEGCRYVCINTYGWNNAYTGPKEVFTKNDLIGTILNKIENTAHREHIIGRRNIVIANYNIGHFDFGSGSSSSIQDATYDDQLTLYKSMLKKIDADILTCSEYSAIFGTVNEGQKYTKDVLFSDFFGSCYEGKQNGYACNAIFSNLRLSNIKENNYHDLSTGYYYLSADLNLDGTTVKVVGAHLAFERGDQDATVKKQMNELLRIYENEPYVIMLGDWNIASEETYNLFVEKGYSLSNCGEFGVFETFSYRKTPVGTRALDNIMVKGFKIRHVETYPYDLSDHYPLVSVIQIL